MTIRNIKCAECNGTGRWHSPAVTGLHNGKQPAQSLQCVACGGHKFVKLEVSKAVGDPAHAASTQTRA